MLLPLAPPRATCGTGRDAICRVWWRFASHPASVPARPGTRNARSLRALAGPAANLAGRMRICLPSSQAREILGCVNRASAHRLPRRAVEVPKGDVCAGWSWRRSRTFPVLSLPWLPGPQERWIKAVLPPGLTTTLPSVPGILHHCSPAPNVASGQMAPGWQCSPCLSFHPREAPMGWTAAGARCCSRALLLLRR